MTSLHSSFMQINSNFFFSNMPHYNLLVQNTLTGKALPAGKAILKKLAQLSNSLKSVLPVDERGSLLDIVCESDFGIFNVEVQVLPQDCWDMRILHHVCGLFHKQFKIGMGKARRGSKYW
mmetsp:Transcript_72061/g.150565  ORF Transcript_72061/g.150565 Transcript_72061/m.150565 type:complete len:120 (+) Transcript_72061:250-609(+)